MNVKNHPLALPFARIVLSSLSLIALCAMIEYDASIAISGKKFDEHSVTEFTQSTVLLILAGLFYFLYLRYEDFKALSFLFFCMMAASFFREQDAFLDTLLYHGSWKIFSGIFLALAIYKLKRKWSCFVEDTNNFFNTFAGGLFFFSIITLYVFSRLFGRKVFWYAVMGDYFIRDVKNAAEECIELFGYFLMLISALEYTFMINKRTYSQEHFSAVKPVMPRQNKLKRKLLGFIPLFKKTPRREKENSFWL